MLYLEESVTQGEAEGSSLDSEDCDTLREPKQLAKNITHFRDILRLQRTKKPPLSSPNPSALRVCASKHSSSGSMSLWARETRA
jgi:hypothetical protein